MEHTGYRQMDQRELQLFQVKVMKRIHNFCVENNIKYYMICGTMLGAIRHGGFIPWDDDMDIALFREDYNKLIDLFPTYFEKSDLFIQNHETEYHYYPGHARISIGGTMKEQISLSHFKDYSTQMYIDIFPLDKIPMNKNEQIKQKIKLRLLDKQIKNKVYQIFPHDNKFRIILKKIRAVLSSIHNITYLQRKRTKVMTQYNLSESTIVCSMASHYSYSKQSMPISYYGTPKLYKFEDEYFYGPEKANEYLSKIYGLNYMNIPPKKDRTTPTRNYIKN